ncbi:helix-turn-helix domain-containing protein [Chryseobacterium sp. RG1]|uniref:Helix-turn-helix domain-containing protein n=1 Tax=Chryseobacterium tagetis TaxID=2801334 RepID=A0ABS8A2W3_9FLAO|nr:helix-turn-helix domain-containing protein [Chryseobacterium tagetis]MCA6067788.1 helix-turn-helix domain-containing protein [Chryseobacterium tagetis]
MDKKYPNYKLIFQDIIEKKFPDKKDICEPLLKKKTLSNIDIININKILFGKDQKEVLNQKHRSYDETSIFEILKFQKQNNLTNSDVARHYKLSKNTIAKWKKIFFGHDLG